MPGPTRIAIAIITRRRPQQLTLLLESLSAQRLRDPDAYAVRIVVVDNDAGGTAADVIAAAGKESPYPISSTVEPEPGIPFARETAVQLCWGDDALIFIDDDEIAPPGWLDTLLAAWRASGADVVAGPVKGLLPPDAPDWSRHSDAYDRTGRHRTGDVLDKAYTGNTLVAQRVYHAVTPAFHPAFRYSGSEDLHFFLRVHRAGFRIEWCEEAVVSEVVPLSRTSLRWLMRRAFRSGSGDTISRLLIKPGLATRLHTGALAAARVVSGFAYLLAGVVLRRKRHLVKGVRRLVSGVGSFAGLVGVNYDEYKRP